MKLRYLTVVFLILFVRLSFAQQRFENAVNTLIEKTEYKSAIVGIHVLNLNSGESIFEMNANKCLIPASTMKLITTATTLEMLGADYRFKTQIGFSGKIRNGSLTGDLIVVGGGDPTLGSEYFKESGSKAHFLDVWAKQIKSTGIQIIEGNLILDGSIYDSERIPDTWIWGDIGNYYGASASAFTVYDNLYRITFKSPKRAGECTKIISTYPNIDDVDIKNEVLSSDINNDLAFVFGSPLDKTRVIRGTIPKNRKAFTIKAAIQNPEELLAKELIQHLAQNGIFVNGEILMEKTEQKKRQTIYIHESPAVSEIMKVLNYESINLFAEHFLKQISAEESGIGSRTESIVMVKNFWDSKGISTDNLLMEDGSGLSHFNAVTPKFFTTVLNYMFQSNINYSTFSNSLPPAGEGTLKSFNTDKFHDNSLRAKSGSMTRVRCYAGYLKTESGKKYAFSFMFNQFSGTHSKLVSEIENLLSELRKSD